MSVGVFEPKPTLTEINLAGNARFHHPLQRAINGGAADPVIFALDQVNEVVGAEVSLLPEEHVHDQIAFAGAFGASRPELIEIWQRDHEPPTCFQACSPRR